MKDRTRRENANNGKQGGRLERYHRLNIYRSRSVDVSLPEPSNGKRGIASKDRIVSTSTT